MLTKMTLEVPIQAVSGLHKFCEENDVRIVTAEFVHPARTRTTLTDDQKLEIAQLKETERAPDVAERYNVSMATVYRIWNEFGS